MHKSPASGHLPSVRCFGHARGSKVPYFVALLLYFALRTTLGLFSQTAPSSPQTAPHALPPPAQSFDLSDEVVQDVLTKFQTGLESHSLDRVLAIFDAENMKDFSRFRDQMTAFFHLHDNIKFRYQLLQVTENKDSGSATAEVEMDADPADILPTEHRRTAQLRFQIKRVGNLWKVTDLTPMDFFTQ